jgi:triacylglycerol esterase/lipase EstA (alpha/beta hydrolase family)
MNGATIALALAAIPLVYFAVMLVLTAMYFALAWFFRARRPPGRRIGPRATLRLVWREYLALAGAVPRLLLHRVLVRDSPPARVEVPVVLVHGVLCNAGIWARFARFLRRSGIDGVYALSYGPPLASIESFAEQLAGKIDAALAATGGAHVVIVAHSMGGLVTRAYLRRHGRRKIARVLTIGTPHHGSMLAWTFAGRCLGQMRPGSRWLTDINRAESEPAPVPITSIWSRHDSMVAPQASADLACARNVALAGIGHNALLNHRAVMDEVARAVASAQRPGEVETVSGAVRHAG